MSVQNILENNQIINLLSTVSLGSTTGAVTLRHFFNNETNRDAYFPSNLSELRNNEDENTFILSGTQFQRWEGLDQPLTYSNTDWLNVNVTFSAADIKTLYESNADTNAFTDAEQTKLASLIVLTAANIKTEYESNADTNPFTDAEQAKLAGIEPSATQDQSGIEIRDSLEALSAGSRLRASFIDGLPSQNQFWVPPVLSQGDNDPPPSPNTGDRYIIGSSPTGAWAGRSNDIAEWNGSIWLFTVATDGLTTHVDDENVPYTFSPSLNTWVRTSGTFDLTLRSVTELNDVSSAGSGAIITASERADILNSINSASISGQVITFTKNDLSTFDITISSVPTVPTIRPDLPDGTLVELKTDQFDASGGAFPSGAEAGDLFRVSVNGTVDSVPFDVHDMLLALIDSPSTTTFADNWLRIEGDEGVSSWGALEGVVDDADIISVLNRLGFTATATVSNLRLTDISDRITEELSLEGDHSITFTITNPSVITACVVRVGTEQIDTITPATLIPGDNTFTVNISSGEWTNIITGNPSIITFIVECTLRNGTTVRTSKNVIRQTLSTHEFAYWGDSATATPTVPEQLAASQVETDVSGVVFDIVTTTQSGEFLFILVETSRDIVSIFETNLNVNVTNTFVRTSAERQINGFNFNLYTLGPASGVEADFRVTLE